MVREVLSEGGSLRAHMQAQFSAVLSPKTFMLIVAAQQRGEIRGDLNPHLIGLSLISLAVFPFAAAPVWQGVAKSYLRGAPEFEMRFEHLRQMARKSPGSEGTGVDAVIEHTLALFDSALEKPHAKSKH